ncbi:S9 family peptidase [Caulobacter sp. NIBR1757]|uniref:alpha/beta hydrolase family protein n=1 Tax=Caulobacter sp. NIBR1757 TaxID=3016000 RepID=UPI0022F0EBA4|nr:S9 family peptidase [Caulobacter sp. NIBR1757]WGM40146.1 Dipeptidyl aminopeptidase BIII [Caulobacter sp. NIBR1757]
MKLLSRGLTIVVLMLGALAFASPSLAAPLSAFGRLPLIEDAQISPDASMVAYAVTNGDARLVLIKAVGDGKVIATLNAGDRKVREIQWATSGYLLISITSTTYVPGLAGPKREYLQVLAYDMTTRKTRLLMEKAPDSMNVVIGPPQVRMIGGEPHVIVEGVHWAGGERGRNSLFDIKLANGSTRVHQQGRPYTSDWVVAADGTPIAQTEYNSVTGEWALRLQRNKRWEEVDSMVAPINPPFLAGLGQDGKSLLLITSDDESDRLVTREYPADGSAPREIILPRYDGLLRNPTTHALMGTWVLDGDVLNYSFFDKKDQAVWRGIGKAYGGMQVHLVSWSDDRRKIVVKVEDPKAGPFYALVDLDTGSAGVLGSVYGGITAADVAEVRAVKYKAADGLEITGYLTLPKGRAAEKLPLIVMPHGGPAVRDQPGFDWWAQGLASRGYAVLQPNFRGSDGFGRKFLEAGYGEWGKKMQSDLSDGVRFLAAQGTIDPARVCIVGASYGGYAALAGATLDKGVYRCAVAVSGVADLKQFLIDELKSDNGRETATQRYWSRFMGVENRRDRDLTTISPVAHVAGGDVPVLLIHGKDDTVVLYNQSQRMYDALRGAGRPVEMVTLKAEDHWLSRSDTRLQTLEATVAFVEKHNPAN